MQKLKAIFAILILLMSLAPCADAFTEDDCKDSPTEQHDDDSHSDSDNCTPFCSCTCCRLNAQNSEVILSDLFESNMHYLHVWNTGQLNSPSFPIWQPPRV